ncbi:MobA/MobL family protein [Staphylococcus lugdunensis]|uniref:MobA/MobL family protein n=1 Tax=Staphylococcus lugdunensis TaxID=28035 RepID=UPI000A095966|nr:MobA/MobL family protein [Staphylococcus lugdunensis]MBM5957362.1 MobA/MobL family protein [Staphylococcus epidermidis]ARJ26130.1 MobA/MobL family protein [Staphylococcus lugdunensis]MCH8676613.1 MobA/MobL family protein [Staphylococcus lugdunensis]MCI2753577.1 MobA/MobL family protein [Staphylococcus lugdunensis]MCI2763199.1 MobA/MobL family protein [Staphylococcus lugdunensis]
MEKGYFMLRVTNINRATKNIVASASYRSDEALYSERTDEKIKFRNHTVKPESMILTPQHAPDWTKDRQRLWNEVDKVEKHNAKTKNPRLAKEVLLSLPNDFDREVQTEITKDFIKSEFVDKGMVADISIHRDDMNNPHAHVLLTQRPFNSDGTWGKKTKTRTQYNENGDAILNKNGNKVRKQERFADFDFKEVRKHWELKLNQYSEREQSLRRYDSRSFEEQGLEKIAEIPLTREEYRLEKNEQRRCEKEGIEYKPVTYYGQKNEQIRRYNRGEVSEVYNDKEKEQAQNEIRLLIQNANDQVSKNEKSYSILFDRYKHEVGYSEAKETIKNTSDSTSTFGRKIQNDLLKNEIKRSQLKYYAKNFDINYKFRKDVESKGYNKQEFANTVETNYKDLINEKNKLETREEKRKEIYQSAKDVYLTENEKNNLIVQQMYPKSHHHFNNDEKAFIVDEAQKGNFIKATDVQYLFKKDNNIPNDVLLEDTYKKASKDIFFSERNLKKLEKGSFEYNVELQFIKEKEKEIDSYKEHIDDDLRIDIGDKNFEKVKDQTPNEKVQLLIKLEKYNNVDQEEVIEKHINQVDRNDNDNHIKHENEQSNHINLPTINTSDFLMYYANETEKQNNINYKKKKKQDRNNQMRR